MVMQTARKMSVAAPGGGEFTRSRKSSVPYGRNSMAGLKTLLSGGFLLCNDYKMHRGKINDTGSGYNSGN